MRYLFGVVLVLGLAAAPGPSPQARAWAGFAQDPDAAAASAPAAVQDSIEAGGGNPAIAGDSQSVASGFAPGATPATPPEQTPGGTEPDSAEQAAAEASERTTLVGLARDHPLLGVLLGAILLVLVLMAGRSVVAGYRARHYVPGAPEPHPGSAGLPGGSAEGRMGTVALAADVEALRSDLAQFKQQQETELAQLRAEVAALRGAAPAPEPTAPPPVLTAPPPSMPASSSSALVSAYIDWCRTAGMLAGRHPQFVERLRSAVPEATLTPLYRDLDSPTRPVVFSPTPEGAAPAEYWLLVGEDGRWLFPQPQSPHQFRDLAPVFEGGVAPKDLRMIQPALVREDGTRYVVTQPGRVG